MREVTNVSYLPSLTGLRFYAALLVVLYHLTNNAGSIPVVSELTRFGRTGVTFFFVLSGFVLAWTYWGKQTSFKMFYWRRFARIWPLHVAATLFTGWSWFYTGHSLKSELTWDNLWPSLLLIHTWFPEWAVNWGWSGASWSLGDEAFFYAAFPIIFPIIAVRDRRFLIATPILMTFISLVLWIVIPTNGVGPYLRGLLLDYFPLSRVVQFASGIAIACLIRRGWKSPFSLSTATTIVVGWHVLLYFWSEVVAVGSRWYPYSASQLFSTLPFAILIATVASRDMEGIRSHLSNPAFVLLGQASFAWYLIHGPIILVVVYWFGGAPSDLWFTGVIWLVVLSISQLLAIVTYKGFEHPVEKWLRPKVSAGGLSFSPGLSTQASSSRGTPPQPQPGN